MGQYSMQIPGVSGSILSANQHTDEKFDFDLIISDMRLRHGENGIAVINSILSVTGKEGSPSLLISGDTAVERISEANESGFALLNKPLRPAVLRLHLIDLLKSA